MEWVICADFYLIDISHPQHVTSTADMTLSLASGVTIHQISGRYYTMFMLHSLHIYIYYSSHLSASVTYLFTTGGVGGGGVEGPPA